MDDRDFSKTTLQFTEAVAQRCSVKKVFLEISQNSQENTCARVSLLIVAGLRSATLLKKRLWRRCFPVNFAKFLRTPFLTEHLPWLLRNLNNILPEILSVYRYTHFFINFRNVRIYAY